MDTVSLDPERRDRFQREVERDPGSLRAVPLGDALRRDGDLAAAEGVVRRCLAAKPGLRTAQLVLARVLVDKGDLDEAEELLDELYPRDSSNVVLTEVYAEVLIAQGRLGEAREVVERGAFIGLPHAVRQGLIARIESDALGGPAVTLPGAFLEPVDDGHLGPLPGDAAPAEALAAWPSGGHESDADHDPFATPRVLARIAAPAAPRPPAAVLPVDDPEGRARRLAAWALRVGVLP